MLLLLSHKLSSLLKDEHTLIALLFQKFQNALVLILKMGICSYSKYSCERKVSQYEDNQKSLGLRYLFITDFKKQLLEKNNSRKPTKEKLMQIIRSLPGG